MIFRFVGSYAEVSGQKLERFGQKVELDQAEGEFQVSRQNVALLPDALFTKAGFTDAELAAHPSTGVHSLAPPEFLKKRATAWAALAEYRDGLLKPSITQINEKDGE